MQIIRQPILEATNPSKQANKDKTYTTFCIKFQVGNRTERGCRRVAHPLSSMHSSTKKDDRYRTKLEKPLLDRLGIKAAEVGIIAQRT